ncbi:transcription activator GLK1-like isoform X2 [Andrographis paniculata]|uniref:transcription activator GLK1-like isoform X2 n=1 Tax=Andrographis paniculata TaxID=175694 RepID=UPI0021E710EC|nr:transcription activator GLK1-like isoform X2 [Andrographis paniculata]
MPMQEKMSSENNNINNNIMRMEEPESDGELLLMATANEESIMSTSNFSTSISDQADKEKEQGCKGEDSSLVNPSSIDDDEGRRRSSAATSKDHTGKKKAKVDWTPELHRKFVEAVEHIGLDKAVPSKILELMGTDCLTRHNVASHLQKYRTHHKNLLAQEAEVASLRQRRRVYGTSASAAPNGNSNSWGVPTTGFPPVKPTPHFPALPVWGYPSSGQSWRYMWPDHRAYPTQPPVWAPAPGSWYCHHQNVIASGMPCFPQCASPMFANPAVLGLQSTSTAYSVHAGIGVPAGKTLPRPPLDSIPSNESLDAAIGEVLSKPWLPLPLGLKPPSVDGIFTELQRQGISKIPPNCAL